MKDGESVKYKTKGGRTHTIIYENGIYSFGFDCERTLEAAKKTLEWVDNKTRRE